MDRMKLLKNSIFFSLSLSRYTNILTENIFFTLTFLLPFWYSIVVCSLFLFVCSVISWNDNIIIINKSDYLHILLQVENMTIIFRFFFYIFSLHSMAVSPIFRFNSKQKFYKLIFYYLCNFISFFSSPFVIIIFFLFFAIVCGEWFWQRKEKGRL